MSHLTVHFDFMALLYSHNAGLTALLPSSGHDATLQVDSVSVELRSTQVTLERDGQITGGSGPVVRLSDGLLHIADVMDYVEPDQRTAQPVPRSELLTKPIERLREISARIVLPGGAVTTTVEASRPQSQYAFRRDGKPPLRVGMERVTFTTPLDSGHAYRMRLENAGGAHFIEVTGGSVVTIANADRETNNTKAHPWYEFAHLLDLLTLTKLEYPFPTAPPTGVMTPRADPCGSLLCGTFIRE